jgi:HD-GYP domain-containing protein (c-di-GMP phosphodiesterase class II)
LILRHKEFISYIDKHLLPGSLDMEAILPVGPRLDEDFFSIPLKQYLSGRHSRFDLFLKLKSNKFVKVLHRGDSFDLRFLTGLEQKGVTVLYLRSNKLTEYLKIQEKILTTIMKENEAKLRFKSFIIFGQGSQILTCLQELHDELCLINIELFYQGVQNLVEEYRIKFKQDFAKLIFEDSFEHHHSVITLTMGIIIAKGQKILSQGPLKTIVMASMFHDISLESEHKEEKLTDAVKYHQHPLLSEKILTELEFFDSAVLQAVRQHHMRVRGESFPELAKNEVLNQISQIVGLADEMSYSLKRIQGPFDVNKMKIFEAHLEEKVFPNFSRGLVDPTKELIFGKKK